jgi:hypothetical protein
MKFTRRDELAFEKAIHNIDYERIIKIMNLLKWDYCNGPITRRQLVANLRLLWLLAKENKEEDFCMSSGGFEISTLGWDKNRVSIKFIVEDREF